MIVDFLLASIMKESIEQRFFTKFYQKLGNNQTETIQKIQQAFGDEALKSNTNKEMVQTLQKWSNVSGK